ncbi:type IV pilus modification PilV family protein [Thermomonas aquatica]|jgi:general secretion pathway protein I|uniref:Prepilin-type N-terminal cleavage/methylation domain-containing protein n=1 Tax=Thermomonas aquatica TaxID=2202149 RepID=A0A5B7ZNT4_9GAMM|nr:prepilin-type N-terminal cleavage/methylation domain-containing protein [Thermomonas aquatica]QDA56944.1 prepilin-type N-terminal cleavage/methylation domain-containing protein [Thermomonas aquatica]
MHRSTRPASRRGVRGFTLLEAIVALVVFSLGAFALYGWLSTNVITLNRIRDRQQLEVAMDSTLDLIRRSNPMETPTGQRKVGDFVVTWTSTPVEPPKTGVDQSGGPSIFMVGLYDLEVRATRDGRELHAFHVRQVGWKQVRTMDDL